MVDADYDRARGGPPRSDRRPYRAGAQYIIDHHEGALLAGARRAGSNGTVRHVDRQRELFGELSTASTSSTAPASPYAHLEHLEREGTVVREGREYRLADGVSDELAELEAERWPLEY